MRGAKRSLLLAMNFFDRTDRTLLNRDLRRALGGSYDPAELVARETDRRRIIRHILTQVI